MNITRENPTIYRPLVNVGATIDIPTGTFIKGAKGEYILNGGLPGIIGIVGLGNNFKSTLSHFFMHTAANRLGASNIEVPMHTYDTEDNMVYNLDRLNALTSKYEYIPENAVFDDKTWTIIPKSEMTADIWMNKIYELIENKKKDKKNYITYECFINKLTGKKLILPKPNIVEIDSFSEFEGADTIETIEKDIENSKTVFMHQGLFKTKVLKDLPRLSAISNMFFILTAHLGKEIVINAGPFSPQPKKVLQYLRQGEKIKGVSDKLFFLTTHLWSAFGATKFINQNTKLPEWPLYEDDVETDLNTVNLQQLRSKSGPSGYILEIIVSQREGILPELTEFNYIKKYKFGIGGNPRSFYLELYPDVTLSRTTIRRKINEDPKLRRAITLTSELCQLPKYHPQFNDLICTPTELYEDIKKKGYDWDELLSTRGWWTIDQYNKKLPNYMSIIDLLLLRKLNKKPYWMK